MPVAPHWCKPGTQDKFVVLGAHWCRFLVPLLLVHGTLSYYRLARLIKYSFYKNIAFAFLLFYYQFYNGFSGAAGSGPLHCHLCLGMGCL